MANSPFYRTGKSNSPLHDNTDTEHEHPHASSNGDYVLDEEGSMIGLTGGKNYIPGSRGRNDIDQASIDFARNFTSGNFDKSGVLGSQIPGLEAQWKQGEDGTPAELGFNEDSNRFNFGKTRGGDLAKNERGALGGNYMNSPTAQGLLKTIMGNNYDENFNERDVRSLQKPRDSKVKQLDAYNKLTTGFTDNRQNSINRYKKDQEVNAGYTGRVTAIGEDGERLSTQTPQDLSNFVEQVDEEGGMPMIRRNSKK